ncbi:MAG TPA: prephenate dehydrogenase [Vicinamibacterales bacterium]|nr:prephenate dehydrogenase [Vicinamibacterales bacterium]
MDCGFRRLAVVGPGLIGGSIELAIRERTPGAGVLLLDRGDDLAAIEAADLIVLSAPILENIRILPALRPHLSPEAIVTDTASTKAMMVAAAAGMRFVGGHPVAGAAAAGRSAARADLFAGKPWVLTPTPATPAADVSRVRVFAEALGASVQVLPPDEHDRLFAAISHLPQLVASALMDVVGARAGADGLALAGAGLRDTIRLASSPPGIWRDIVQTNHANITESLEAMIAELTRLRDDRVGEELTAIFERAAQWKRTLGG